MNTEKAEKEPRLNITAILIEEEQLSVRFQQWWASLEEAKHMALSQIKHKYSQYDY